MCQVGSLMNIEPFLCLERLLAGGALHLRVLAVLVGLQCDLAAARVITLLTRETDLELVHTFTVVSQCNF